jgi:hypothetical protein
MNRIYELWPRSAFAFNTSESTWYDPLGIFDSKKNPNPANAIASLPVPVPTAPVTAADPSVLAAQNQFAQANLRKKTIASTITPMGGDTGGFKPGMAGYPGNPGPAPTSYKA